VVILCSLAIGLGTSALVGPPRLFPEADPAPDPAPAARVRPRPPRRCHGWPVLVGHDSAGVPRRAYIKALRGHREVAMELDTGSATSFVPFDLTADPSVERTHEKVRIGEVVKTLPGRRMSIDPDDYGAKERHGLPVSGVLGAEEVLRGTTDLDLRSGCLTQHPRGYAVPEAGSWLSVPFKVVNGVIVTHVEIDGEDHGALFDTGVGYSILISDKVEPFVAHQIVHDVRGLRVDLYDRRGYVRWADGPREEVWVERTLAFRTFDDMLLGDVRTMVGISAMGSRRIIIDPAKNVLLVEPPGE
jgi:hypothetical protein